LSIRLEMSYEETAALATFLGGIGLFFTGIRSLSAHMLHLGGKTLRRTIASHGQNRALVALSGTLAGAFLQSTNGITFILVGMVTAGLLPLDTALGVLAWANLGTTALVMLSTSVNLHVPILLTLGCSGIWLFFDRDRASALRPLAEVLLAIALLFLGLELLRVAMGQLREFPGFDHVLAQAGRTGLTSFLAGVLLTLPTQSFTTTAILGVASAQGGLLSFGSALLLLLGAGAGAGLSVYLTSRGILGSHRQLILFQVLNRFFGVSLVLLLLGLESATGWPLLLHWVRGLSHEVGRQLGLIYLACQVSALAGWYALRRPCLRFLARVAPPLEIEELAEAKFVSTMVPIDTDVALTLAAREQCRLVEHLFEALQRVDEHAERAFAILSAKIAEFLTTVLRVSEQDGAQLSPAQLDAVANLQARNETLRLEHETVCQIAKRREALGEGEAGALAATLVEGLGALLIWANDCARSGAAEDLAVLHQLTTNRSELVDSLRRGLLHVAEQDEIYALTSLFERAVWLLQRYAQLLSPLAEEVAQRSAHSALEQAT
jgi:phosphate:Na+ symporter